LSIRPSEGVPPRPSSGSCATRRQRALVVALLAQCVRHVRVGRGYGRAMVIGSIASQFASGFGLTAAAIAVFGFLAHAKPALAGASERRLRSATVIGGLGGFVFAVLVVVLSALIG
jgi:hypothetical protein